MELTAIAFLLGSAVAALPGTIPLEKITDNTMLPPGVSGSFFLGSRPVSCLGDVFFTALEEGNLIGLYAATPQGLAVIANRTTPVPGSSATFEDATRPDCGGDRLVFVGTYDRSPVTGHAGIYTFHQGSISLPLLETGMPLGDSFIQNFSSLDANEMGVVADPNLFPSTAKQVVVVKLFNGDPPFIVADRSTVLPGQTEPVTILDRPIFVGTDVYFHARTDEEIGIYRWREGEGITLVADSLTPVPLPGQGSFGQDFGVFANLGGRFVFEATFLGGVGIFAFQDGEFEPVVLPGELTAQGATLVSAAEPRGGGNLLTFIGRTEDFPFLDAVFVKQGDAPVRRILGVADTAEGHFVDGVESNADDQDVFVWAQDLEFPGFQVIYRAQLAPATDVPALSWFGAVALGLGLALAGWWALRRL
jgi:hypothetical protein